MFIHGFGETVRIYGEIREEGIRSRTNSNYLSRYGNWFVLCFFFEYFAMGTHVDSSFITFLSEFKIYYRNVELQMILWIFHADISRRPKRCEIIF